jgi:PII-like signaling protein
MTHGETCLLRIYVGGNERQRGKPLYETIVQTARALKLAGASVFPVEMSFGAGQHIHDALSEYAFTELPLVVEIVEAGDRVEALLVELGELLNSALVTVEPAKIVGHSRKEGP